MKNPELNRKLVVDGYVTMPVLSASQVEEFSSLYKRWHPTDPKGFYKSYFSSDRNYKLMIESAIISAFQNSLEEHFMDYHAFGGMFVIKPTGERGQIPPHQDWSFVDETKYWSLNAWCPLIDTTGENGNIQMLPGSHLFRDTIRGSGTPEHYSNLYSQIQRDVVDIPLKAGECVFFHHGILHCSTFNNNVDARVSLGLSLIQKNAPIHYHFLKEGDVFADRYVIDNTEFYLDYVDHRGEEPKSMKFDGKDHHTLELISEETYLNLRKEHASLR
ncbi:MAG: phytanoyl-CoA dioxygenase family protein [Flavobacteriales bacterium]|nr:phytanoyl-CoA dioxygenase family protein [Flavobacteriales bacterium]